ncbi:MAG: O-antigen ligase family protein [Chloroflexi bacterium]|nr:O-antigen ligase family protein [Chloroflexota bacterium]
MPGPAVSQFLIRAERLFFAAALVASPFRLRAVLAHRPVGTIYGDYTDFLFFISDGCVLLLLTAWGLRLVVEKRAPDVSPKSLTFVLLAFTVIAGLSSIVSVDRALSLYHFLRLASMLGFFVWVVDSHIRPARLAWPVATMVGIQALVGIQQFLSGVDASLQPLGEYELDPAWPGVSIVSAGGERWLRAYGLSDHPNILGGLLAFGTILLFLHGIRSTGFEASILSGAYLGGLIAMAVTFSRSAWLAFMVAQVFMAGVLVASRQFGLLKRQAALLALGAAALLPIVGSHPALFSVRLGGSNAFQEVPQEVQSLGERALLNVAANEMFVKSPILGVGLGASPQALAIHRATLSTHYQPPHNALLAAAAETGIFGAAVYALLLGLPWLYFIARQEASVAGVGVYALLLAATLIGFFDYYTWLLAPGRFWQYLIWGLAAVQIARPSEAADE